MTPPVRRIDRNGMHRLIPSRFSEGGTVLGDIADDDAMLQQLIHLDGATNDRIQGEQSGLAGISTYELVYGIPNAHIIRAAFLHTSEAGSRFNDAARGAWYAADTVQTSLDEVGYHKARRLAEIVVPDAPDNVPDTESSTWDDWLADFHADFHVLDPAQDYADCLAAEPVPECYAEPQRRARQLIRQQSNGIVYPSVRRKAGKCLVCFRPALVYQPRRHRRYEITFTWERQRYKRCVKQVLRSDLSSEGFCIGNSKYATHPHGRIARACRRA